MKKPLPNNYPMEGSHSAVTAEDLQNREHRKWDDHSPLEYMLNAGQANETIVYTTVSAQRQASIDRGHRILRKASNDLNAEAQAAMHKPLAIDFNEVREEAEQQLDEEAKSFNQDHGHSP